GAVALLILAPALAGVTQAGGKDDKDVRIEGKLTKNDPRDKMRNAPHKAHVVVLRAANSYTIDMVSNQLDSYLRLEDPKGRQLAQDDDSGGNQNAGIVFNCQADGKYRVICTGFDENSSMGSYVLTVRKTGSAPKVSTPHVELMKKPAPDFTGDFALNGKPVKL